MAMTVLRNNLTSIALKAFDKSVTIIGKALTKVANGQKIVDAKDDASQYALSQRMRNMIRDLNQSSENIQNGSTMLKVAEGAVSTAIDIVRQMKEKAVEAADVNMTDAERRAKQKELDELIEQINDNSRVQFNGKYLLDGQSSPLYSTKYSREELIARGLNSAWIRDSLDLVENTYGLSFTSNTAKYRKMEVFIEQSSEGDSPVSANLSDRYGGVIELHVNANYFDEKYFRNANGIPTDENGLYFDRYVARAMTEAVLLSNVEYLDTIKEQYSDIYNGLLSIMDGGDDDNFAIDSGYTKMRYMAKQTSVPTEDFIREFARVLAEDWPKTGSLDASIAHATGGAITSKADLDARVAALNENNLEQEAGIILENEDIGAISGSDTGRGATKNARTSVREVSTPANWRLPSAPSTFMRGLEIVWQNDYVATADSGGGFQFQIGINATDKMNVGLFNMSAYGLGLIDDNGERLQITTQGNAKEAINVLGRLISTMLEHQADIGAIHQRVQFTTNNLENSSTNIEAAESTIRDADMAKEMTELSRGQALNQASQSMLAQANQNSEKVLQVLSNDSAPIEVHANTIQAKHELDENLSEVGKDLKQISSGQKVVDPTDGSSQYQIGEGMKVKLRTLERDSQNVQNGSAILKVAQGSIEAIVTDLTNLKEIAIDASNAHNTDVDRRILQKTFDQLRDKIDELTSLTTYNDNGLIDGRYQRYHLNYNEQTSTASIHEAEGLTVHHGSEAEQSVRFFIDDMHAESLGGSVVRKEDLDDLLNNREFINSRSAVEIESLTELQKQLQQLREDTAILKKDENLQARLQGVLTGLADENSEEGSEVNIKHAVMREYLDIGTNGVDQVIQNLDKYEFLKPMVEEEMVISGLTTRLDDEGNAIESEEAEEGAESVKDLESVEILKDAAGKSLADAKIDNVHNANVAMRIVTSALNDALDTASTVGAYLSRLEFTGQNIETQITNTTDMDSHIRDADMARSMAKYMKDNLALNASQSMLSNAIHDPMFVLSVQ